jgi:hypothetical protein
MNKGQLTVRTQASAASYYTLSSKAQDQIYLFLSNNGPHISVTFNKHAIVARGHSLAMCEHTRFMNKA